MSDDDSSLVSTVFYTMKGGLLATLVAGNAIFVALFGYECCTLWYLLLLNIIALVIYSRKFLYRAAATFKRDFIGIGAFVRLERFLKHHQRSGHTVSSVFRDVVRRHPDKPAFISVEDGRTLTYQEAENLACQIANYFAKKGLKEGDVVALYMNNCLEYVCIWLGLSKIGVVSALINFNQRLQPLGHSITIAKCKAIILGADLQEALAEAIKEGHVSSDLPAYVFAGELLKNHSIPSGVSIDADLAQESKLQSTVQTSTNFKSVLFYIYTSGTTGLPKAAVITHGRFFFMAKGVFLCFQMRHDDRLYITMPMYHSAAGILGVGQMVLSGVTCVVRKKFSASNFWDDCVQYHCTAAQYIGEICRYLLAQPVKDADKKHKVWLMYGNGLRAQIWDEFTKRFNIRKIGEFYGSTEGNSSLLNVDSKPGACGFLPIYGTLQFLYPVAIMKVDEETGELIRDKKGLCIRCQPGESGEAVSKIIKGSPIKDFVGYVSQQDTSKKIVRDVFSKGDHGFASGDVLFMDEYGYLYFRDRRGDTFRWKGENVSTTEIEAVIHKVVALNDATVYGVEVPGSEGRAGMAAIVDENENCDLSELGRQLKLSLPAYARPIFLRLCKQVDTTGTYKLKKTDLQKAGFDPAQAKQDRLYYLNTKSGEYEKLTDEIYRKIVDQSIRF